MEDFCFFGRNQEMNKVNDRLHYDLSPLHQNAYLPNSRFLKTPQRIRPYLPTSWFTKFFIIDDSNTKINSNQPSVSLFLSQSMTSRWSCIVSCPQTWVPARLWFRCGILTALPDDADNSNMADARFDWCYRILPKKRLGRFWSWNQQSALFYSFFNLFLWKPPFKS